MAVTMEQVEKLHEKSGASYEACRDALERAGGDLLEALIYLERTGRSKTAASGGFFTTEPDRKTTEAAKLVLTPEGAKTGRKGREKDAPDWRGWLRELWDAMVNLLRHAVANQFEIWRKGTIMSSMPVIILVALVIVAFWITVPLLIVGLFLGCRYRFSGPDLDKDKINDMMGNVTDKVGGMVDQVKREFNDSKKKSDRSPEKEGGLERQLENLCGKIEEMAERIDQKFSGKKK